MELVVTTAIMGTLVSVAVPSYLATQMKTQSTVTISRISAIGNNLGQLFQEYAGDYGEIILVGAGDLQMDTLAVIMRDAPTGANFNLKWGDIYSDGVPTSPFGDLRYLYSITNTGKVSYQVDDVGNPVVLIEKAQILIWDQESPPSVQDGVTFGLYMNFSY